MGFAADQFTDESVEQPVSARGRTHKSKRSDFMKTSFLINSTPVGVQERQKVPVSFCVGTKAGAQTAVSEQPPQRKQVSHQQREPNAGDALAREP